MSEVRTMDEDMLARRLFRAFGIIVHGPGREIRGISEGEIAILGMLSATGESLAPGDIADRLQLSSSRIANALKTLERKGFVTREINPADRRGIIVSITPEGVAFGRARFDEAIACMRGLISDLGEEDASELARILERIQGFIVERTGIKPPPLA